MKVIQMRGLTDSEYNDIKAAAKNVLTFNVNIRMHKNTAGTFRSIDIRPTKANGYTFNEEQVNEVIKFAKKFNLISSGDMTFSFSWMSYIPGFNYLRKLA